MLEMLLIGGGSLVLAASAGAMATKAHVEMVKAQQEPESPYDFGDHIPEDMQHLLRQIDEKTKHLQA